MTYKMMIFAHLRQTNIDQRFDIWAKEARVIIKGFNELHKQKFNEKEIIMEFMFTGYQGYEEQLK